MQSGQIPLQGKQQKKVFRSLEKGDDMHLAHQVAVNYRIAHLPICSHPKPGSSWFNLLWL